MRRLTALLITVLLIAWPRMDTGHAFAREHPVTSSDTSVVVEPLVIVVNRSNPIDELSSAELRKIFLGNRSHWPNGRRITLVMREPGEPERNTILRDVCAMTEDQFKNHFLHGLYTGEILVSPKILASPVGVRKFIFNVPGAIGYLRIGDVDPTVKVVRIDELLPEDKGYKLHVQAEAMSGN
jgi:ABC-type phosphate transport system substrate-binding protein